MEFTYAMHDLVSEVGFDSNVTGSGLESVTSYRSLEFFLQPGVLEQFCRSTSFLWVPLQHLAYKLEEALLVFSLE